MITPIRKRFLSAIFTSAPAACYICGKHSIRQIIDISSMVKWNVYVLTVYTIEFEAALQLASKQELLSMIVMLIKSPYFNLWYRQR